MSIDARPVYVYALQDPRIGLPRYVGRTVEPQKRLRGHIHNARGGRYGTKTEAWIVSLLHSGHRPEMVLLQKSDKLNWQWAERFWISFLRWIGADLTNLAVGGKGAYGRRMPDAERMARKNSALGAWQTRRLRYGPGGVSNPEEASANMSRAFRGRAAWNKDRKETRLEVLKKISASGKGRAAWNKGRKEMRPEVIEKLRASHLDKKQSEVTIRKRIASRMKTIYEKSPLERSEPVRRGWATRRMRYGPSGGNA